MGTQMEKMINNPTMDAILGISRNLSHVMDRSRTSQEMTKAILGGTTVSNFSKIWEAQDSVRKMSAPMEAVLGVKNLDLLTKQVREHASAYDKFLSFSTRLSEVITPPQVLLHGSIIPALASSQNYVQNRALNTFDVLSGSTFCAIQKEFGSNAIETISIDEIVEKLRYSEEFREAVQEIYEEVASTQDTKDLSKAVNSEKLHRKVFYILYPQLRGLGLTEVIGAIIGMIILFIISSMLAGPLENVLVSDNTEELTAVIDERSQRIIDSTNVQYNEHKKNYDRLSEKMDDLSKQIKEQSENSDFLIQDAWIYEKHNLKSKKLHLLNIDAPVDILEKVKGWVLIKATLINGQTIEGWMQKKVLNGFQ
jgi:hypothetical protein